MTTTVPSIPMHRLASVEIDWKRLSKNLIEVATQGFVTAYGITDGISGAITAFIDAAGSLSLEDKPEQRAWEVFWLGFAWSLDELRSTVSINEFGLRKVVLEVIEAAKALVDSGGVLVPSNFIEQPTTLPIYKVVRDALVDRKAEFRLNDTETAADLSSRFDASFNRAIFNIWLKKPELLTKLDGLNDAPGLALNSLEMQWQAYRQQLIHDFDVRPMFGQEEERVSLSQMYIPLRCFWKEGGSEEQKGFTERSRLQIESLDDLLMRWVTENKSDACVKLIGGGPGSGKSTSVRRIARWAADKPSLRPLYIPLQHISLEGSLRDAVNQHFTGKTRGSFTVPPLARDAVENGPRLLLIFDGLDEIARPGEGADEIANLFITKLDQLQNALDGDAEKRPKIVVTGRMPSFQAAKKFRGALDSEAVEVMGYAPYRGPHPDGEEWDSDQRPEWWRKYSTVKGLDKATPKALSDTRLRDITNEPLLCYLLVISGFAVDDWESAAENRNRIYERLINEVWKRGWGDSTKRSDRQGPGRHLSKENFNALMENIALAAWLGGDTRVATEERFLSTLKITQAEEAWREFGRDDGQDVANLAMNFYLKSSDGTQRGFEFTHKSFGDYLAARAIMSSALEMVALIPRYIDAAMQTWLKATSTGDLTIEINNYLRDQARILVSIGREDDVNGVLSAFELLIATAIDEGLPAHKEVVENWRAASRQQRSSETMLWAVMSACLSALRETKHKRLANLNLPASSKSLKVIISRLAVGEDRELPVLKCFNDLDAAGSDLFGLDLSTINFDGSDLSKANFNGTHLMNASLRNCNLTKASFERSNLDRCKFHGSNLDGANFADVRSENSDYLSKTTGTVMITPRSLLDQSSKTERLIDRLGVHPGREDAILRNWRRRVDRVNAIFSDIVSLRGDGEQDDFETDEFEDDTDTDASDDIDYSDDDAVPF